MDWRSRFVLFIMVLSFIVLICGVAFAYDTPEMVAIDKQNQMYNQKIIQARKAIEQLRTRIIMNLGKKELLIEQEAKKVKEFEDKLKKEEEAKKAKETEKNNAKVQEEFTKSKLDDVIEQIKKEEDKK